MEDRKPKLAPTGETMALKLKLWLVLLCHGVEGLGGFACPAPEMAATLEAMVRADARFEVLVPAQRSSPWSSSQI